MLFQRVKKCHLVYTGDVVLLEHNGHKDMPHQLVKKGQWVYTGDVVLLERNGGITKYKFKDVLGQWKDYETSV